MPDSVRLDAADKVVSILDRLDAEVPAKSRTGFPDKPSGKGAQDRKAVGWERVPRGPDLDEEALKEGLGIISLRAWGVEAKCARLLAALAEREEPGAPAGAAVRDEDLAVFSRARAELLKLRKFRYSVRSARGEFCPHPGRSWRAFAGNPLQPVDFHPLSNSAPQPSGVASSAPRRGAPPGWASLLVRVRTAEAKALVLSTSTTVCVFPVWQLHSRVGHAAAAALELIAYAFV